MYLLNFFRICIIENVMGKFYLVVIIVMDEGKYGRS